MNVIALMGRLTRDPEVKFGQSGNAYTRFSIAVNRQGNKDEADFINCVAFSKTAELIGEYFRKGSQIGITGRLQMNQYDKDGEKRTTYDVVVDRIDFISDGKSQPKAESKPKRAYEEPAQMDNEFPF